MEARLPPHGQADRGPARPGRCFRSSAASVTVFLLGNNFQEEQKIPEAPGQPLSPCEAQAFGVNVGVLPRPPAGGRQGLARKTQVSTERRALSPNTALARGRLLEKQVGKRGTRPPAAQEGPPGPEPVQGGPLPEGNPTAGSTPAGPSCREQRGGREQQPASAAWSEWLPCHQRDTAAARPALLVSGSENRSREAELLTQLQTEQNPNDGARGPDREHPLRANKCEVRADWVTSV